MNAAIAWFNANEKYLLHWLGSMAAAATAVALFLFATQWFIVAFAITVAIAGYTQIGQREFFNAGVAFTVAIFIGFVGYFA